MKDGECAFLYFIQYYSVPIQQARNVIAGVIVIWLNNAFLCYFMAFYDFHVSLWSW